MKVTLPAVVAAAREITTPYGLLRVPEFKCPERTLEVVPDLCERLRDAARQAAGRAHAPYSRFHVGAAVVMADDPATTIFTGANVENSSYGLTNCAERTAIFSAVAGGFRRVRCLAVSCAEAASLTLEQRSPCGACRQVISEFSDHETVILIDDGQADSLGDILDVDRLLPFAFRLGTRSP